MTFIDASSTVFHNSNLLIYDGKIITNIRYTKNCVGHIPSKIQLNHEPTWIHCNFSEKNYNSVVKLINLFYDFQVRGGLDGKSIMDAFQSFSIYYKKFPEQLENLADETQRVKEFVQDTKQKL